MSGGDQDFDPVRAGARSIARRVELRQVRAEAATSVRRPTGLDIRLPDGVVDPETGRRALTPSPTLELVGEYLRRSRLLAGMTQIELARASGVSQPMISRAERARAPAIPLERVVLLCAPLGRLFPLGVCPHDHECVWQPHRPTQHEITDASRFIKQMLRISGEPTFADDQSSSGAFSDLEFIQRE